MKQIYDVHVGNEIFKGQNLKYDLQPGEIVTFKKNPNSEFSDSLTGKVIRTEPSRSMLMNTQLWVEEIKEEENSNEGNPS